MIQENYILSLHSGSSIRNVAVALVKTDGLDILDTPKSFHRPFPEELQENFLQAKNLTLADEEKIKELDTQTTLFFIDVLNEAFQKWPEIPVQYIVVSGIFLSLSAQQHHAIELGNLQQIANTFQKPVIGRFVQSDMNAGGTGSPLLSVFWQQMTKNLDKPLGVVGLGGVLKLTYIGENGELGACDIGVGLSLIEKWMHIHGPQSEDEIGTFAAKGKPDLKVVKALMNTPFLSQPPPKAIHRNDFDDLLEQLEGLSLSDGCATLIEFIVQMIEQSGHFFTPQIEQWLFIGSGRKNTTLMLQLAQRLKKVYRCEEVLPFHSYLNAVGYAFLGGRFLADLPISLPTTTGSDIPMTCGMLFSPK